MGSSVNTDRAVHGSSFGDLHWAVSGPGHAVQFYESDAFRRHAVVDFLARGLGCGQPVVSLASTEHTAMFLADLTARGFMVDELVASGRLAFLDARKVIEDVIQDVPDRARFRSIVGGVIERAGGRYRVVRAYGEAVDLLWQSGRPSAALQLEHLWNALAVDCHIALLCGYAVDNFMTPESAAHFERVCGLHQHVIPTTRSS